MRVHEDMSASADQVQRLVDAGQVEQALDLCEQNVLRNPRNAEMWNTGGHLLNKLNRPHDAIFYYHKSGECYLSAGELAQSIAAYKRILQLQPNDAKAHLALAAIYRTQGQSSRAALSYELAAQALSAQGRTREALAAVQRIVEMSPENVARRIRLAEQYAKAQLITEALRELRTAEAFLLDAGRIEEASRLAKRISTLEAQQKEAQSKDPSLLVAEAESFLRLGLFDQATAYLEEALAANPGLRPLREPLAKLYVVQGRYHQAVGELRQLLSLGPRRPDEIRLLRYVLRLDSDDHKAQERLNELLTRERSDDSGEYLSEQMLVSVASVDRELRSALHHHRPRTDLAQTAVLEVRDNNELTAAVRTTVPSSLSSPPDPTEEAAAPASLDASESTRPPSATTRPGAAQIEAIAEEIALSSQSFRDKLFQIDRCVQRSQLDEALQHAQVLASCYPHNQTVHALLAELQHALSGPSTARQDSDDNDDVPLPVANEIAAAMRALSSPDPSPSSTTPPLSALLPHAPGPTRVTQEVDLADVQESSPLRPSRSLPPAPPKRKRPQLSQEEAEATFEKAMVFREHGDPEHAIHQLRPLLSDATLGVRAALQVGQLYRSMRRLHEAIAALLHGVNRPTATQADLSELFYELGQTYALVPDAKEAILFFQLSIGRADSYRDAAQRIASLQDALRRPGTEPAASPAQTPPPPPLPGAS